MQKPRECFKGTSNNCHRSTPLALATSSSAVGTRIGSAGMTSIDWSFCSLQYWCREEGGLQRFMVKSGDPRVAPLLWILVGLRSHVDTTAGVV
jgi:hypothetical protein